jgi:hypothetical protein
VFATQQTARLADPQGVDVLPDLVTRPDENHLQGGKSKEWPDDFGEGKSPGQVFWIGGVGVAECPLRSVTSKVMQRPLPKQISSFGYYTFHQVQRKVQGTGCPPYG